MASPSFSASGSTLHTHNSPTVGQGFLRVFLCCCNINMGHGHLNSLDQQSKRDFALYQFFLYSQFQHETNVCTFKNIALKRLTFYL